jgi:hypothetical protein
MNIFKISLMSSAIGLGLSSCVSEELPSGLERKENGSMSINVDMLRPSSTRAVETKDFPVKITSTKDNTLIKSYDKASEVPNKITLPVGNYFAEAHTPGELQKIMTTPYYKGRDDFEILQGINTKSTVTCKMANGSFKVKYSDEFASAFATWTISIDDGTESVIQFTNEDGLTPATIYMTFEENVNFLTTNFKGTTTSGNKISTSNKLTKKQASEQYDNDDEYFSGGDAIVINFSPVESTEGDITGITLNANISFEETEKWYDMEVTDKGAGGDNDNPGGGNTGGDSSTITLDLPSNMIVDASTDPSLGDTYIYAENGIQSITVGITSTSPEMIASLQDLAENYEGVDFLSSTEIVENQTVVTLFNDLGQSLDVPTKGQESYTFPIGNFFLLLAFLPGEHTFSLTVTDMNGNSKSGSLTLTVE